jgi:hypothetical protein
MSKIPAFDMAPTPVALRLLELYQRDLGLHEEPKGSNLGPKIQKFLDGWKGRYGTRYAKGAMWCALACEYLAREAYDGLGVVPCPLDDWHGLGGASGWLRFAAQHGALLEGPALALPGDVAVIYDPVKDHGHVCVVALPLTSTTVYTMDGNHGDVLAWADRPVSAFAGFVRLPFPR